MAANLTGLRCRGGAGFLGLGNFLYRRGAPPPPKSVPAAPSGQYAWTSAGRKPDGAGRFGRTRMRLKRHAYGSPASAPRSMYCGSTAIGAWCFECTRDRNKQNGWGTG